MNNWEGIMIGLVVILFFGSLVIGGILLLIRKTSPKKWMFKELAHWKAEGLIDAETIAKIESRYEPAHKESMPPTKIIILVGSILFGIGLIIFIASNWETISGQVKLMVTFSLSLISLLLGYWLKYRPRNPLPILGEGLLLVASLIWGATIIFLSQNYHVSGANNYILTFIWGATIFPIAWWFKSDPVYYLSYFLLFLSGILLGNLKELPTYYFLLLALLPFLLTSEDKRYKWIPISILALFMPVFTYFPLYGIFYLLLGFIFIIFWFYKKDEIYASFASSTVFFFILTGIDKPLLETYLGHWLFLIPLAILLALAIFKKSISSLFILLFSLLIGFASQINQSGYTLSFIKLILLVGLIYLLVERFFTDKLLRLPFQVIGYFALIIGSFVLSFHELIKESLVPRPIEGLLFYGKFHPWLYLSMIVVLVLVVLLFLRMGGGKEKNTGDNYLYIVCGLSLVGMAIWEFVAFQAKPSPVLVTLFQNAFLLLVILLTIFWASKRKLMWLINTSLVFFLIFVIMRYFDVSWKYLERSWFFIGGGFVLLVIGAFMETLRRKLTTEEKHEE